MVLLMLKGRVFPGCIAINNSYAIQLEFTVAFWCKWGKKSYEKSLSSFLGQEICLKKQANKQYWIKWLASKENVSGVSIGLVGTEFM